METIHKMLLVHKGHTYLRGIPKSLEARAHLSEAKRGKTSWVLGHKFNGLTCPKCDKIHKDKSKFSNNCWMTTPLGRAQAGKNCKGRKRTANEIVKQKETLKRNNSKLFGIKNPAKRPEVRAKISSALKLRFFELTGKNGYLPYGLDYTKELRLKILEDDEYLCQMCGSEQGLCIHHIDYDKKHNTRLNLITLCRPCHGKTNYRRTFWIAFFILRPCMSRIHDCLFFTGEEPWELG